MIYDDYLYKREALPILKEGDTGDDVIILQQKLKQLGYFLGSITGSFDYYTKQSIIRFQEKNNISENGIVGPLTWGAVYEQTGDELTADERETKPTLRLGNTGEYVNELQERLKVLMYYTGVINGKFDDATATSVKTFQINNNLTADGVVGRNTWAALEILYSPLGICDSGNITDELTYTVKSGDTLYSIAKKFNTNVNELKSYNNLNNNVISINQVLKIPTQNVSDTSNIVYTVVSGDTLYNIARKFSTSVDDIKNMNNLISNTISIGQKLIIPTITEALTYTVKSGDTLYSIAKKFNTNVNELKKLNDITNNVISINQVLKIPK